MHQFNIAPILRAMAVPAAQHKFLLHLFTLWLSMGGRFNFTNLSRYSPCHERTFRRGFARSFRWAEFNQRLLAQMIPSHHPLIAVMDASFITKSGKCTPELGWFFNGCVARVEKGLEASVVAVADVTANTAYALLARQTPSSKASTPKASTPKASTPKASNQKASNQKASNQKASNTESRLVVYLRHLQEARPFFPDRVRHLAVDGYYTCRSFVDGVCALQLDVIGKLRHNASLCYLYTGPQKSRGRKRFRDERVQWAQLDMTLWQDESEIEKGIRLYTVVAYHNSLKRKIKVALLQRQTAKGVSRTLLFSTDLELSGQEIVRFYRARFQIEFLFRDSKGSLGLEHCQSRQTAAIEFHWNASLCALTLAKYQEERCVQKQRFSVASCKQKNSNRHLMELFAASLGLDVNALKLHPTYQFISNQGVIQP